MDDNKQNPVAGALRPFVQNHQTGTGGAIATESNLQHLAPPPPHYRQYSPAPQHQHQAIPTILSRTPEPPSVQSYFPPPPRSPQPSSSFVQSPIQQPSQQPFQAFSQQASQQPQHQSFPQSSPQPVPQSSQLPAHQAFPQTFHQSVQQQTFEQPLQQSFQQPFQQQAFQQPIAQPLSQPLQQNFQQPFQQSVQQPVQQPFMRYSQQPGQLLSNQQFLQPLPQPVMQFQQPTQQPSQQPQPYQQPPQQLVPQTSPQPAPQEQPSQQPPQGQVSCAYQQVPQVNPQTGQIIGYVWTFSQYATQQQMYLQPAGHNSNPSASFGYQPPPSPLPIAPPYQPPPAQPPMQSQHNNQSVLTSLSSESNNQMASTSTPQRNTSLMADLSNVIQSKTQSYLSKIKEAQNLKSSSSPAQGFVPVTSQSPAEVSDLHQSQTSQHFATQYSSPPQTLQNNQQTWPGTGQDPQQPARVDTHPTSVPYTPQPPLTSFASGNVGPLNPNMTNDASVPPLATPTKEPTQSTSTAPPNAQFSTNVPNPNASTFGTQPTFPSQPRAEATQSTGMIPPNVQFSTSVPNPSPSAAEAQPTYSSQPPQSAPEAEKKKGLLSNIISQLENMAVSDLSNLVGTTKEVYVYEEGNDPPIYVNPISASGNAEAVPRVCFSHYTRNWEATWYHFPAAPSFLICTWCMENYIRGTPFGSLKFETSKKSGAQCNFRTTRMTKVLWPAACQTEDLSQVSEYVIRRQDIPHCKGAKGAVMVDKVKWFTDLEDEIPGFVSCEACYEDILLATGFAGHFKEVTRPQGPNDKWVCDVSLIHVKRAARMLPKNKDANSAWTEFVRTTKERMALPECTPDFAPAHKTTWYRPRYGESSFDCCKTCFMDRLAFTRYAREYDEVVLKDIQAKYTQKACDFQLYSMKVLLFFSLYKHVDFSTFNETANFIVSKPRCQMKEGITGGKWYNLKPEVGNFGLCEGCYAGVIVPHGLPQFWTAKPVVLNSSGALYCIFNADSPRFMDCAERFDQSTSTGEWAVYADYVRKWVPILICEKRTKGKNRAWYGWPACPVCQDCYENFAAGTSLAQSMPYQGEYLEQPTLCCLYSPRMREMYRIADAAGSAAELLAFNTERLAVYEATIPKVMEMSAEIKNEMDVAGALMVHSTTMRGIDASDAIWGYGRVDYYGRTVDSGAASHARAMAGYERANDPARFAEMRRLETMWEEVE